MFSSVQLVNTLICQRRGNCESRVIFHTSGCFFTQRFSEARKTGQLFYRLFLVSIRDLNIVCCPSGRLGCKYFKGALRLKTDGSISSELLMERSQKSIFANDQDCKLKNINKSEHFYAIDLVFSSRNSFKIGHPQLYLLLPLLFILCNFINLLNVIIFVV